ncbi:MAG: hypothetical protein IT260_03955 [Saprospiraceae bacterium]|nr:hypothetical protein [Saprospiraceae bacterium]
MPIVIKELIIKTTLIEKPGGGQNPSGGIAQRDLDKLKRAVVAECTERVKKYLDKKLQR